MARMRYWVIIIAEFPAGGQRTPELRRPCMGWVREAFTEVELDGARDPTGGGRARDHWYTAGSGS